MTIRRIITIIDDVLVEGGRPVTPTARVAIVAAVISNPWCGQKFVEGLSAGIIAHAFDLGALLAPRIIKALGAPVVCN